MCSGLANETWPPLAPSGLDQATGHLAPSLEAHALRTKQDLSAFPQALWRRLGFFCNTSSIASAAKPLPPHLQTQQSRSLWKHVGRGSKGTLALPCRQDCLGALPGPLVCTRHPPPSVRFFSCGTHVPQHTRGGQGTTEGAGSLPREDQIAQWYPVSHPPGPPRIEGLLFARCCCHGQQKQHCPLAVHVD